MPHIAIDDADLYYEVHRDGPPLMLVSGLAGVASFWLNQIAAFSEHLRVVVHDHRGCG